MANTVDTQLLIGLQKATAAMKAAENKDYTNSSVNLLMSNEAIFGDLESIKQSKEQPVSAMIMKRDVRASGTDKRALHEDGNFADSFKAPLTWLTRTQFFNVSRKIGDNNYFIDQEQMNHQLMWAMANIRRDMNAAIIAQLATDKSQIADNSLIDFNATNDAFENPAAKIDFLARNMKAALKKNKFGGAVDIIADQFTYAELVRVANQGAGNATNLGYQIDSQMRMVEDEQLVDATYTDGCLYAFGRGLFGMTTWNETLNRSGEGSLEANQGMFTTLADPLVPGLVYDVHAVKKVADTSASNGNTQDVVTSLELSATFCIQAAVESTATSSPIYKVGVTPTV